MSFPKHDVADTSGPGQALDGYAAGALGVIGDDRVAVDEDDEPPMTFNAFAAAIHGRVTEVLGVPGS